MKKEMYLHIPEPCHENWEQMNAVQQGRYCQSCCKRVVDFTNMSDKQILDVLSKAADKTCGRFAAGQLERPIADSTPPLINPYKLFLSAFIPAFLLANGTNAKGQTKGKVVSREVVSEITTMGLIRSGMTKEVMVTGMVKDENNQPVAGASIIIEGTKKGTSTDAEGNFLLLYQVGNKRKLQVSSAGYETIEMETRSDQAMPLQIILPLKNNTLKGDVAVVWARCTAKPVVQKNKVAAVVTKIEYKGVVVNEQGDAVPFASIESNLSEGVIADSSGRFRIKLNNAKRNTVLTASSAGYQSQTFDVNANVVANDLVKFTLKSHVILDTIAVKCDAGKLIGMVGGLSVVRTVTIRDTASTFVQKVFNNELFKAYPNPAAKGSNVNLVFKNPGTYALQLFDNSGRLYQSKEITTEASKQTISLSLPLAIAPGMYFLKAVNSLSGKQFIEKIIIR